MSRRLKFDVVFQDEPAECGLACIAMICGAFGRDTTLEGLRKTLKRTVYGVSLTDISRALRGENIGSQMIAFSPEDLKHIPTPAILHLNSRHFVILERSGRSHSRVINPALGKQILPNKVLTDGLSGYAIILDRNTPHTLTKRPKNALKRSLINKFRLVDPVIALLSIFSTGISIYASTTMLSPDRARDDFFSMSWLVFILIQLFSVFALILLARREAILSGMARNVAAAQAYSKLCNNQIDYIDSRVPAEVAHKISSFTEAAQRKRNLPNDFAVSLVIFAAGFSGMLLISPLLTAVSLLALAVNGFLALMHRNSLELTANSLQKASEVALSFLVATIKGIPAIKSSGAEAYFGKRYAAYVGGQTETSKRLFVSGQMYLAWINFITNCEMFSVIYFAYVLAQGGTITLESSLLFIMIRQLTISNASALFGIYTASGHIVVAERRIAGLFEHGVDSPLGLMPDVFDRVDFPASTFSYSNSDRVLRLPSLSVVAGEKIAVCGESGSGKTSLLRAVSGQYAPNVRFDSVVLIDDVPANSDVICSYVYYHSNADVLFPGSIRENIALGSETITARAVGELFSALGIGELIGSLPNGMESEVSEDAHPFSSGERQRLLLCRALLSSKPILLLDEPTSNLDAETAAMVANVISQSRKTILTATHDDYLIKIVGRQIHANFSQVGSTWLVPPSIA